jgi:hypothetical protein
MYSSARSGQRRSPPVGQPQVNLGAGSAEALFYRSIKAVGKREQVFVKSIVNSTLRGFRGSQRGPMMFASQLVSWSA